MHRAFKKFALRAKLKAESPRRFAPAVASVLALALCAGLTACAEDTSYPSLSKISDLGTILTPEERQKAVQDLQKQDQTHNSDAAKTQ